MSAPALDITYRNAMAATEHKSDIQLTTSTPYLALMGELLMNGTTLYNNIEDSYEIQILTLKVFGVNCNTYCGAKKTVLL